ncbi:MAG TPA: hypothetical protein VM101_14820 [Flavitalea sp.]|nr:hypothetical protein [Flavitalea sp.]
MKNYSRDILDLVSFSYSRATQHNGPIDGSATKETKAFFNNLRQLQKSDTHRTCTRVRAWLARSGVLFRCEFRYGSHPR